MIIPGQRTPDLPVVVAPDRSLNAALADLRIDAACRRRPKGEQIQDRDPFGGRKRPVHPLFHILDGPISPVCGGRARIFQNDSNVLGTARFDSVRDVERPTVRSTGREGSGNPALIDLHPMAVIFCAQSSRQGSIPVFEVIRPPGARVPQAGPTDCHTGLPLSLASRHEGLARREPKARGRTPLGPMRPDPAQFARFLRPAEDSPGIRN